MSHAVRTIGSRSKNNVLNTISSCSVYTEITTLFPVSALRCEIVERIVFGVVSPKVLLSLSSGGVVPWVKNSRSLSVRVWWCVCVCVRVCVRV